MQNPINIMPRRAALNAEEDTHSAQHETGEISSLVDGNAAAIYPEQGGHNPEDTYLLEQGFIV